MNLKQLGWMFFSRFCLFFFSWMSKLTALAVYFTYSSARFQCWLPTACPQAANQRSALFTVVNKWIVYNKIHFSSTISSIEKQNLERNLFDSAMPLWLGILPLIQCMLGYTIFPLEMQCNEPTKNCHYVEPEVSHWISVWTQFVGNARTKRSYALKWRLRDVVADRGSFAEGK